MARAIYRTESGFATVMFIIFWNFLIAKQFFLSHKWNEALLFVINCYIWVPWRVNERLKTLRFYEISRIIAWCIVLPPKWKLCHHQEKSPAKQKFDHCQSALSHMKTRVCFKYPWDDCSWQVMYEYLTISNIWEIVLLVSKKCI